MSDLELTGNFLDAKTLDLNEDQYCGLMKTLALLESGALDHENEYISEFNMQKWSGRCGTACCIGGTATAVMGKGNLYGNTGLSNTIYQAILGRDPPWVSQNDVPEELSKVFYPGSDAQRFSGPSNNHPGWNATTKEAAQVLRHYMETGKGDWDIPYRK